MIRPKQQFAEMVGFSKNAGSKAVRDCMAILDGLGYERIQISRMLSDNPVLKVVGRVLWVLNCIRWRRAVKQNAEIVIQFTVSCFHGGLAFKLIDEDLKRKKNLKIITLIHDLNRADPMNDVLTDVEKRFFAMCDKIIAHNESMKAFLVRHGVDENKIVCLQAFDYLIDGDCAEGEFSKDTVSIAGNLSLHKCGYLSGVKTIRGVNWQLFGATVDPDLLVDSVRYCGSFNPDNPSAELQKGFGLVWDGDSPDTCSGMFGKYMSINNPHKMSLYLAMGMPVIIWSGAAEAKFVLENEVGVAVDSLTEVPCVVAELSDEMVDRMRDNAIKLSKQLRSGGCLRRAVEQCLI